MASMDATFSYTSGPQRRTSRCSGSELSLTNIEVRTPATSDREARSHEATAELDRSESQIGL